MPVTRQAPGSSWSTRKPLVASLAGALPLLLVEGGGGCLLLGDGATQLAHALTAGEHERLKAGARKRGNGEEFVTVLEGGHLERLDAIGHAGAQLAHALTAGEHERLKAGARKRGNGEEFVTVLEGGHLERLDAIGHAGGIALVGDDDLRTIGKVGCIAAELIVDDAVILEGITCWRRRSADDRQGRMHSGGAHR